jgi:hypothetical protein
VRFGSFRKRTVVNVISVFVAGEIVSELFRHDLDVDLNEVALLMVARGTNVLHSSEVSTFNTDIFYQAEKVPPPPHEKNPRQKNHTPAPRSTSLPPPPFLYSPPQTTLPRQKNGFLRQLAARHNPESILTTRHNLDSVFTTPHNPDSVLTTFHRLDSVLI